MPVRIVTPPAAILAPDDVRLQLRLGADVPDDLLQALIAAAQGAIDGPDGWLGRAIGVQTLELTLDGFCNGLIVVPCPPLIEVVSVKYDDVAGDEQTMPSSGYVVLPPRGFYLRSGNSWPTTSGEPYAVRIEYRAGYETIPAPIKHAVILGVRELLTAGAQDPALRSEEIDGVSTRTWTISADTTAPLRQTMERLLGPYRVFCV